MEVGYGFPLVVRRSACFTATFQSLHSLREQASHVSLIFSSRGYRRACFFIQSRNWFEAGQHLRRRALASAGRAGDQDVWELPPSVAGGCHGGAFSAVCRRQWRPRQEDWQALRSWDSYEHWSNKFFSLERNFTARRRCLDLGSSVRLLRPMLHARQNLPIASTYGWLNFS